MVKIKISSSSSSGGGGGGGSTSGEIKWKMFIKFPALFNWQTVYNLNLNSCCTMAFKYEICRVAAFFISQTSVLADICLINCCESKMTFTNRSS